MITKSVAILCFLAVAYAATIQQRTIPVEIRYDEGVQITPKELRAIAEEVVKEELVENAVKNLDAKVQLSPEELTQSLKHLPVPEETFPEDNSIEKSDENPAATHQKLEEGPKQILVKKAEEVPQKVAEEIPQEKPEAQENVEVPESIITKASTVSLEGKLQHLRDIVVTELRTLRDSFKPKNGQLAPNPEQWDELLKSVSQVYDEAKNKLLLKQAQIPEPAVGTPEKPPAAAAPAPGGPQGIFQNFVNGVNGLMQNFVQNIQGARPPNAQGDEGQPGNQGGFIGYFQSGVNNIMNLITNGGQNQGGPTTSSTVLGDTGSGSPAQPPASGNPVTSFFGGVVNNFQQILGIQQSGSTGVPSGTQGDTGVNPPATSNQQGPGAQFVQAIGNTINSIFQGGARPPAASGDEGTPPAAVSNGPQNIFASIGNAFSNSPLNPFRPPNGGAANPNPVQTGIQTAGNQIQQAVSGIQGQFVAPPASIAEAIAAVTPVVELTGGQRKPTTETIQTKKPDKVENDNEIEQKVEQKEEILTTAE